MEITQYEYKKLDCNTSIDIINQYGEEGWDISLNYWDRHGDYFLKRPCGTVEITPKKERNQSHTYNAYSR